VRLRSSWVALAGLIRYQEFYPSQSKPIIDEIDKTLASHYGFTEDELDFIISYDIKYRLGRDAEAEDEQRIAVPRLEVL
jgi:hypothetical protein